MSGQAEQKVAFLEKPEKNRYTKKEQAFADFNQWIYNRKDETIMGKSALSWLRLLSLFFLLYLSLLVMMTSFLIVILQLIISDDVPYINGPSSPLSLSPGLGMRPRIDFKTALIAYTTPDPQTYMPFVQNIRTFVYFYEEVNIKPQDGFATCGKIKSPDEVDLVCKFYPQQLGPCVKENNYGYDRGQPCVILKINKVYGWLPDILNSSFSKDPLVRCHGQNSQDLENFGQVRYFPNVTIDGETYGYFSNLYFPYLVQVAYRSPLVAVQFASPKRHVLLMVRCEFVNIRHQADPLQFELLVD